MIEIKTSSRMRFYKGELMKSKDGIHYVLDFVDLGHGTVTTVAPLSKWKLIQILQVFIYRIKYK
jgi:hypothetical protein